MKKKISLLVLLLILSAAFGAFASTASSQPRFGGILKATINSNPISFDPMLEGGSNELIPAAHIFETALATGLEGNIYGCAVYLRVKSKGMVL